MAWRGDTSVGRISVGRANECPEYSITAYVYHLPSTSSLTLIVILSLAYSPGHLYHLFFVTGPIFYARLHHEKDNKKVLAMIDKIDSGPWTVYEPWFEYCFPECVHLADQWLVGKYGEDTAEHASATGLQGPAPGWEPHDWDTPGEVSSFDMGLSCFALGKCK